ncbi:MAG TPA: flagellar biosynthetic protein FliO [Rhizomicrobium sp.]|jgi:flagellar protein FliO/FliZ
MDLVDFARYIGALLLVLGLLGCAWLAARRFGLPGIVQAQSVKRLSIAETLMVGPRHKILLVKRDGTEHLILMGPQGASVIESGIVAPVAASPSSNPVPAAASEPQVEAAA